MKKSLFFAGLAAALSLVGCNKEADYAGNGRKVEIVLSDVATRTINSGMSTEWNAGDELSVFNAAAGTTSWSSNIKFTVQDASANRATGEVELTADAYDWYAFYPYTRAIPNPTTLNPEGSTYERSGYTTVGGQFQTQKMDDNMEHLAGVKVPVFGNVKNVPANETPVIEMKNAASVVRFKVVNDLDEAIKVLSVKFTAPEDIVGTYYIDFSGTAPAFVGSGDTYVFDNVMVTNADPSGISPDSNADYYAVIKPFTAAAGAKLKVEVEAENADGTKKGTATKEITLAAATEFKPGYIKLLNIPFDATMTTVTAQEIPYEESFEGGVGKFTIDNVIGSGIWTPATASGQNCMKGTSFISGSNTEAESWLISPEIDGATATNGVKLSFKQCINKYFGDVTKEATLWAREKGGEWKQFTISYPALNGTWSAFEEQVVDLSEFKGKTFQFAFKYVGHATAAGTWEVCNVAVTDAVITPEFNAELPGADESLSLTVPATTTSVTINVTGNVAWAASASDGAAVAPTSGEGAGTVKVTFPANTDPANTKEYSITVSTTNEAIIAAGGDEFVFNITQEAASTEAKAYPYEETFETSQGDFMIDDVKLGDGLTYVWKHDASNKYMKASAYAGSNKESESWLVSPVVDLEDATSPALYFSQCINKYFGDVTKEATVWIKEEGGEWNQLTIEYPALSGNWSKMTDYTVDIKSYAGKKVQVGFKYISSTSAAGTWEIKNFKLDEAVTGPVDPTFTAPETLSVEVGKTAKINVTTNSDGAVTFATSDAAVATVAEDGTVTGVAAGTANVTVFSAATANFNAASATVAVTVTEAPGADDIVFDFSSMGLTNGTAYTTPFTESGVSVQFTGGGNNGKYYNTGTGIRTYSGAIAVSSESKYIEKIVYTFNNASTTSGDVEYFCYPVEGEWSINVGSFAADVVSTWTGEAKNVVLTRTPAVGHWRLQKVVVTLGEEAPAAVLSSISVEGQKTAFNVGDTFSHEGAVVTALYNDGTTKTVTDDAVFSTPDMTTAGSKTVTITYTEADKTVSTTYSITVAEQPAGDSLTFVFDEKSAETGTNQWPAAAASSASTQTYTLNGNDYTFALGENTYMGSSSGKVFLMVKSGSYLGLPAIAGKKLVKVQYTTSSGASTGTYGAICKDTSGTSPVTGGESIALNQLSTEFSWTLSGTEANTMYYFVASKKNSQTVKIVLTYE